MNKNPFVYTRLQKTNEEMFKAHRVVSYPHLNTDSRVRLLHQVTYVSLSEFIWAMDDFDSLYVTSIIWGGEQ
jgi:hypothetical protein